MGSGSARLSKSKHAKTGPNLGKLSSQIWASPLLSGLFLNTCGLHSGYSLLPSITPSCTIELRYSQPIPLMGTNSMDTDIRGVMKQARPKVGGSDKVDHRRRALGKHIRCKP
jgi:hypothetical protein